MAITRHSAVVNMDTLQPLDTANGSRVSRGTLHRWLRAHGIPHDAGATREEMVLMARRHNISGPPAVVQAPQPAQQSPPAQEAAPLHQPPDVSRFPKGVFQLRKMCKDRGIPWTKTDKRDALIARIQDHIAVNGY